MYNNYGFNPYYQNNMQRFQPTAPMPTVEPNIQPTQPTYIPPMQQNKVTSLLGKSVDSIDVVKAMDIPLDGSISYFPLTDGSAIVTKQLRNDGTSKTIVYKPTEEEKKEEVKFATIEDVQKSINEIDLSEIDNLREEIKTLKSQIKDLKDSKRK